MTQWKDAVYRYAEHTVTPSNSLLQVVETKIHFEHVSYSFVHLICSYGKYFLIPYYFPVNFLEHHIVNQMSDTNVFSFSPFIVLAHRDC